MLIVILFGLVLFTHPALRSAAWAPLPTPQGGDIIAKRCFTINSRLTIDDPRISQPYNIVNRNRRRKILIVLVLL